jgi:hypothetical protein
MTLMPCFGPHQAPAEGMLIGQILAGYGELEVAMCACIIAVEGQFDLPIRKLFNERSAEKRIKDSKKALTLKYTKAGLHIELAETLQDMEWCRKIRNQYAHCQWSWTSQDGLCFVNLEELAKQPKQIARLMDNRHSIDVKLLDTQEEYFNYVKERFTQLETAYQAWDRARSAPRLTTFVFPMPPKIARPPAHN